MLIDHLTHRVAQEHDELVERVDLALQLDPVHEIDRNGNLLLAQRVQKRILQRLTFRHGRLLIIFRLLSRSGLKFDPHENAHLEISFRYRSHCGTKKLVPRGAHVITMRRLEGYRHSDPTRSSNFSASPTENASNVSTPGSERNHVI